MEFNEKVSTLRKQLGLTLEQVGNAVGVGKSTVRKWEAGSIADVGCNKLGKLADALHTSPTYLMGWKYDKIRVTAFLSLERSGVTYDAIDASLPGYMTKPVVMVSADKNIIRERYGDYVVVGFEPKTTRRIALYIVPPEEA